MYQLVLLFPNRKPAKPVQHHLLLLHVYSFPPHPPLLLLLPPLFTPSQIGTAVAVVAITALQLANVDSWSGVMNMKLCKASADPQNLTVCTYIYAVGGVSILLTIVIGLMQVWVCVWHVCVPVGGCRRLHEAAAPAATQCYNIDWKGGRQGALPACASWACM